MKLDLLFAGIVTLFMITGIVLSDVSPNQTQNTTIYALVDLSGDWSSMGNCTLPAMEVAAQDVNSYLKETGSSKRVVLMVEDSGTNPTKALEGFQNLTQNGARVIIAATTSEELKAIKDYADDNGIIIIGAGSTAPSLAIPDDNIIRLIPDDTNQGFAIAQIFKRENISKVVPINRGDKWGDDLLNAAAKSLEANGGTMLKGVRYSPGTNFSSEAKALSSLVKDAKMNYGSDNVGVYLVSLDEAGSILALVADDPELSSVKWFGSDGTAGLKSISENRSLAQFAIKTDFICPIGAVPLGFRDNDDYKRVANSIRNRTTSEPLIYSIAAYDAFWATWESIMLSESLGSNDLKEILTHTINRYLGITGLLKLNSAEDREYVFYDLMAVKEENGSYSWKSVGGVELWDQSLWKYLDRQTLFM